MLPFDWLEDMGVMRHVQADLHLFQRVLVSLVRALKLSHQFSQRAVCQRFVHQVLTAAHAQRTISAIAVDAKHNVVEAVA